VPDENQFCGVKIEMATVSPQHMVSCLAVVWAILLPFLPLQVLNLFRGVVGSLALLLLILAAASLGPQSGVLVFLAALLTFVQRNRSIISTKMSSRTDQTVKETSYDDQMASAPPMDDNETHPLPQLPPREQHSFLPSDDDGSNNFEAVDSTINEKNPIKTISPLPEQAADYFLQQGFADTTLRG
jgi:hypothetical protein